MPTFKFSAVVKKSNSSRERSFNKSIVIENKVDGIIRINDKGYYVVEYKDKFYDITSESFNSKGKKCVYAKKLDKYNHRIKIIRDKDSRIKVNSKFYCPFAPGLIARGKLVKTVFGPIKFHIVTSYNITDVEGIKNAFREWKEYESNLINEEIDERNEL